MEPGFEIPCLAALLMTCCICFGRPGGYPAFAIMSLGMNVNPPAMTVVPLFFQWFAGLQSLLKQYHHGLYLSCLPTMPCLLGRMWPLMILLLSPFLPS